MTVTYHVGDTRAVVATLPDASVSLVASSPPFIALRSYLPDGHPDKHAEIGSEPDPATFLDTLLALTAEWGRVLAPWGSIAIELGDTYAGSSAQGTDQGGTERYPNGRGMVALAHNKNLGEWPRAKSLALIPQLYAASLAYGRNLLTGQPSPAGQWLVRNVIVWHRPNPAVGALGDKVRPSTSYITVATRSPKRWFDLDAVRQVNPNDRHKDGETIGNPKGGINGYSGVGRDLTTRVIHPAGAPPLDCWFDEHDTWTLTTQPSSLAHFAMWPAKLAERLILMMCPAEVCATCGTPRRRLTAKTPEYAAARAAINAGDALSVSGGSDVNVGNKGVGFGHGGGVASTISNGLISAAPVTLGWSDCGCGDGFIPGTVLDPFAGTGTTLAVADLHGRDAVGIDLDERNRDLHPRRRDECARALFDIRPQMAGQLDMFGETNAI